MTAGSGTKLVRTACPAHCGRDACGILAHVRDGRVIKVEPADFPDPGMRRICLRGLVTPEMVYHPDRLKYPMKRVGERGAGKFERVSWEEALDTVADRFREIAGKYGWRAIGWVLGGPGSGTTKFGAYLRLASLTQSTRVSTWGYGDAGLPCGSRVLFGTHSPYELLANWDKPGLIIVWGSNPGEAATLSIMRRILDARERGAQVVVIDPRFTTTASRADEYLGIKTGTDTALALGMMHVIFQRGLQDEDFIRRHTVGPYLVRSDTGAFLRSPGDSRGYLVWDSASGSARSAAAPQIKPALSGTCRVDGVECRPSLQLLMELVEGYPPRRAEEITGIPAEKIIRLAEAMASTKSASIIVQNGLGRTYHGDIAIRAIGTLAAVTGNVHLTASSGHRPVILNWEPFLHAEPGRPSFHRLGVLKLYDAAISGKPFPIKAVYFAFINFLNQCVDSNKIVREVFPNLEFIVLADNFMTPTARYADIILPVCSYLEFSDLVAGRHPYLQLQQKVIEPLYESKSDVAIVGELARRLGFGNYFKMGEEGFIELLLDSRHPSVAGVTLEKLKRGPVATSLSEAAAESPATFSTPSGKIELYAETLHKYGQALPVYLEPLEVGVESTRRTYPLSYIQGHSRFRTHSMLANSPALRELNPEPVVAINPVDAAKRGIADGDIVTVFNNRGRATLRARVTEGVRPGVVDITEGWWREDFREGGGNALTHDAINPVQDAVFEPNMAMNDVAVEVRKVGG